MFAAAMPSAWASAGHAPEGLCEELALFANATPVGKSQKVELMTDWTPTPADPTIKQWTTDSIGCEISVTPPARRLCAYLRAHSATEFGYLNYDNAMACAKREGEPPHISRGWKTPAASHLLRGVPGVDEDVELTITYRPGESDKAARLIISARRAVRGLRRLTSG
jgi:hypothetical protein